MGWFRDILLKLKIKNKSDNNITNSDFSKTKNNSITIGSNNRTNLSCKRISNLFSKKEKIIKKYYSCKQCCSNREKLWEKLHTELYELNKKQDNSIKNMFNSYSIIVDDYSNLIKKKQTEISYLTSDKIVTFCENHKSLFAEYKIILQEIEVQENLSKAKV